MATLPVSSVVSVAVNLSQAAAQAQNLSNILILGNSQVIDTTQRVRTYASSAAVAADFGSTFVATGGAAGQSVITTASTYSVSVGQTVSGTGVAANTTVTAVSLNSSVTISNPLSVTATGTYSGYSPEYFAAVEWFAQSPQPSLALIGQWNQTATYGRLQGAYINAGTQIAASWAAVTTGSFVLNVTSSGTTTPHNITGISFAGAAGLSGNALMTYIATQVTTAITSYSCICTWNSVYGSFIVSTTAGSAGTGSAIPFLTTYGSGTDVSGATPSTTNLGLSASNSGAYAVQGLGNETCLTAITLFDASFGRQWYAAFACSVTDADSINVAGYIESSNTKHAWLVNHQEGAVLTSGDTTNISYKLQQLAYRHTVSQYSSTSLYAVVSLAARIMTTNYNANKTVITTMYKQEPGIVAETQPVSAITNLIGYNCNVFEAFDNNTNIITPGVTASGDFIDIIFGADWLSLTIQQTLYNVLYTSPTKIDQTDAGTNILVAAVIGVLDQGVSNGYLAAGTWTQAGFGSLAQGDFLPRGYYVYAPPVASQNPALRALRQSVVIQVAAKLAGAVQTISLILNINR